MDQKIQRSTALLISNSENYKGITDISKSISIPDISLSGYVKRIGKEPVILLILFHLKKLISFIDSRIDETAINDLKDDIYTRCWMLSSIELTCMFNNIKTYKYITRSASEILANIDVYIDRRFTIAESNTIKEHHNRTSELEIKDDDFIKMFYEHKKKNPIEKTSSEESKEFEDGFRKFYQDYIRNKLK